jgi:putative transcriptional regulator
MPLLTARQLKESYRVPDKVNVRSVRKNLHMSQQVFSHRYGFALDAVQDWEQGRRKPNRSARVLLMVIAREPDAVNRALRVSPTKRRAR